MRLVSGAIAALLSFTLALPGCSSGPEADGTGGGSVTAPDDWPNNPGLIQDHLAAVGIAPIINKGSIGPARTFAETDGRAKLAAALEARISQLVENWAKQVGDMNKERSFSDLINQEAITRQFVDATVRGAVPDRYKESDGNVYVLMVLKDPSIWTKNIIDNIEDQALKDETLFKTEVMKQEFRDRMDRLRKEETEAVRAKQQSFQKALSGESSSPGAQ